MIHNGTAVNILLNRSFAACCLSNLLFWTSVYVLVPVLPLYLVDVFHTEKSLLGVILSLFGFSAMAIRPFAGFLIDNFRRRPLYLICYFLFTAYFIGYLLAGTLLILAVVRVMHGMIFSVATTAGITTTVDLLPLDKQGRGIGIFGVTTSASILFGPITGLTVLNHFECFHAVFAVALAISTIALLIGATIRFNPPNKPVAPVTSALPATLLSRLNTIILTQGLRMALCVAFAMFLYGAMMNYMTLFAREQDIADEMTGYFLSLFAVGLIVGRLIGGWFVDIGCLLLPVIIGKLLSIAAVFVLGMDTFLAAAVLCGLGYGIIFPSYQTIFIRLARQEQRGIGVSTYRTATDFGIAFAILCGGMIAQYLSFFAIFLIGAALTCVSIILFTTIAIPHFKRFQTGQFPQEPIRVND